MTLAAVPDLSRPWPLTLHPEDARDRAVELAERDLDGTATDAEVRAWLDRYCPLEQPEADRAYCELVQAIDDRERLACGDLYPVDYCGSTDPAVAADRVGGAISAALTALFPTARELEPARAVGL